MLSFPSRFRRLDEILADLPVEEPMLLSELDGYLTGIAVSPEPIPPAAWLPPIWDGGYGEGAPFEDPIDVQLFAEMVQARHAEILRALGRGKLQPIFDIDERHGEVLWDAWIAGFALALEQQPDAWAVVTAEAAAALAHLRMLADVARDESGLGGTEINALYDEASTAIPVQVARLFGSRGQLAVAAPVDRLAKVGRNDPCPCGSGKKHKRCCG